MSQVRAYNLLAFIACLIFAVFEFQFLNLPFFLDEVWVYGPAVQMMAENGPSLLPDAISVDFYRGHPQLFHFLYGVWIKFGGDDLAGMRLLSLFITICLGFSLYYVISEWTDVTLGFLGLIVFFLQPLVLAQATMVLPEMMLALWALWMVYFYFKQGFYWLYWIFSILLVLTKESGIVLVGLMVLTDFVQNIKAKKSLVQLFLSGLKGSIPLFAFLGFLALQKMIHGWYLFPEHVGYLEKNWMAFLKKLIGQVSAYFFIYQGRNFLFFTLLISFAWLKFQKKKVENKHRMGLLLILILGFLVFSALNFFTNRYLLCVLPFYILLSLSIAQALLKHKITYWAWLLAFIGTQYLYIQKKNLSDNTLGFASAIELNKQVVEYAVSQKMYQDTVWAFFVTRYALGSHYGKYVSKEQEFKYLPLDAAEKGIKYYIVSNTDFSEPEWEKIQKNPNLKRIYRAEKGLFWAEVYSKNPVSNLR